MTKKKQSDAVNDQTNAMSAECDTCQLFPICKPIQVCGTELSFVEHARERRIPLQRGEYLFRRGEHFKSIYALWSGSIKTFLLDKDENECISGFHFAGELIASDSIHSTIYHYNAQALETSFVCNIQFDTLQALGFHVPIIQSELIRLMGVQITQYQELLFCLTGKRSAEEKLAAFLLNLLKRFQQHGLSGSSFRLSMNRSEIGCYLGLAKETVGRLFSQFQEVGLIAVKGRQMEIVDGDGLALIAGVRNR